MDAKEICSIVLFPGSKVIVYLGGKFQRKPRVWEHLTLEKPWTQLTMISPLKPPGAPACISKWTTERKLCVFSTVHWTMEHKRQSAPAFHECFCLQMVALEWWFATNKWMPFLANWFVVRVCNVVALIAECISIPLIPTSPMLFPLQPFPEKWCDTETL